MNIWQSYLKLLKYLLRLILFHEARYGLMALLFYYLLFGTLFAGAPIFGFKLGNLFSETVRGICGLLFLVFVTFPVMPIVFVLFFLIAEQISTIIGMRRLFGVRDSRLRNRIENWLKKLKI